MKKLLLFLMLISTVLAIPPQKQVEQWIDRCDRMTLFSIESTPGYIEDEHGHIVKDDRIHGYRVLGQVDLPIEERKTVKGCLIAALDSVKEGTPNLCFEPREAVRLFIGSRSIDLLLCFHCGNGVAYVDEEQTLFFIGRDGYAGLGRILASHGIPREKVSLGPNQSLEPMARCVTPRARHESRRLSPWLTIKR